MNRILAIILLFLDCQQRTILLEDTRDYIAFHRDIETDEFYDTNVWLKNTRTGEEVQITDDPRYLEYEPMWLSKSELLYLIDAKRKVVPKTTVGYINFATGDRKQLDYWTWNENPGMYKLSIDSLQNIYFGVDMLDAVYQLRLGDADPELTNIISPKFLAQIGLEEVKNPVVSSDGKKMLIVACDTAKYQRLKTARQLIKFDIYLVDLGSLNMEPVIEKLTYGDFNNRAPVWLDNDNIIYASNKDGNYEFCSVNLENKITTRLTHTENIDEIGATVVPNDKRIAYTKFYSEYNKYEIWIMHLETGKTDYLTDGSGPAWCPVE